MVRPAEIPVDDLQRDRYLLTGADLERMAALGMFAEQRVELLHGELYVTPPQDPQHASVNAELAMRLAPLFAGHHARTGMPLECGHASRPEPDLAIVRGRPLDWAAGHPAGGDTALVVEVARTSHARDAYKASIYAAAGTPEYWILDLVARRLQVHTEPGPGGYGVVTILDEHHATALGDTQIRVGDLLPKA